MWALALTMWREPDFGYAGAARAPCSKCVLEHGQTVGRLIYEKMLARPVKLYGEGGGSNYQAQGLKLSKHFRG